MDRLVDGTPVQFSSLRFRGPNSLMDYDRVAFESNIPSIETATSPGCDQSTCDGCVNPPPGAAFYPIFNTGVGNGGCVWQFGGPNIAGTINTFGGSAAPEYGPQVPTNLPVGAQAVPVYNIFGQVVSNP